MPFPRNTLLSEAYPEAFAALDLEKNAACGINVNTLTCKTQKKAHWLCPVGHSYERSVCTRAGAATPKCRECQLFINHKFYPLLCNELDTEKNEEEGLNINEFTYGSHVLVNWKCFRGHLFKMSINQRACKPTVKPAPCKQCTNEDKQKYICEIKDYTNLDHPSTGHATELYVKGLLEATNSFDKVEQLNAKGGDSDIRLTYPDGDVRYLQVKTLSSANRINAFHFLIKPLQYPDNMLVVMVSKTRDRFGLCFYEEIKEVQCVSLTFFSKQRTKREHMLFIEESAFVERMLEMIPHSVTSNRLDKSKQKEIDSMERLEKLCIDKGWKFELSENDHTPVDGLLDGKRFQAKFIASPETSTGKFYVRLHKKRYKDGKRHYIPYYVGDFDLLIVEYGGDNDDENKYKGRFCVIPAEVLIDLEILASDNCKGAVHFGLYPPDHPISNWPESFWV